MDTIVFKEGLSFRIGGASPAFGFGHEKTVGKRGPSSPRSTRAVSPIPDTIYHCPEQDQKTESGCRSGVVPIVLLQKIINCNSYFPPLGRKGLFIRSRVAAAMDQIRASHFVFFMYHICFNLTRKMIILSSHDFFNVLSKERHFHAVIFTV